MRIVFAKGRQSTKPDFTSPLAVNNCGYYRDITEDISVLRKNGREDYQIIFVRRGELEVENRLLRDGSVFVFTPGKPQSYRYKATPRCCYYWAHFTGNQAQALAEKYALVGEYDKQSDAAMLENLFLSMTDAFINGLDNGELFAVGALLSLTAVICSQSEKASPFRRARAQIADLSVPLNVGALASSYNVSDEHFIRSFKVYCGLTPLAYRQKCRVEYAKRLLSGSTLSISAVAEACGFDDPLYFSRFFKKQTGLSPREYRDMY